MKKIMLDIMLIALFISLMIVGLSGLFKILKNEKTFNEFLRELLAVIILFVIFIFIFEIAG